MLALEGCFLVLPLSVSLGKLMVVSCCVPLLHPQLQIKMGGDDKKKAAPKKAEGGAPKPAAKKAEAETRKVSKDTKKDEEALLMEAIQAAAAAERQKRAAEHSAPKKAAEHADPVAEHPKWGTLSLTKIAAVVDSLLPPERTKGCTTATLAFHWLLRGLVAEGARLIIPYQGVEWDVVSFAVYESDGGSERDEHAWTVFEAVEAISKKKKKEIADAAAASGAEAPPAPAPKFFNLDLTITQFFGEELKTNPLVVKDKEQKDPGARTIHPDHVYPGESLRNWLRKACDPSQGGKLMGIANAHPANETPKVALPLTAAAKERIGNFRKQKQHLSILNNRGFDFERGFNQGPKGHVPPKGLLAPLDLMQNAYAKLLPGADKDERVKVNLQRKQN